MFSQEIEVVPPYNIKTITFSQNVNNTIPFLDWAKISICNLMIYMVTKRIILHYRAIQLRLDTKSITKNEYLNGLDNQRIQNYQNSLNCLQIYSHYTLSFPNKFNQIIKSGNYIVKIFDEDQEIVFSKNSLFMKTIRL